MVHSGYLESFVAHRHTVEAFDGALSTLFRFKVDERIAKTVVCLRSGYEYNELEW